MKCWILFIVLIEIMYLYILIQKHTLLNISVTWCLYLKSVVIVKYQREWLIVTN